MTLQITTGAEPILGYRLIRLLGQGGFGHVWEAAAPGGLHVALKFIRTDTGDADSELRALQSIRDVRHPHLLDLHFAQCVQNYAIIATSLCDKNLWNRYEECVAEGAIGIPEGELLRYMRETAIALDFLNEPRHLDGTGRVVSIQHRDIKPLNLFLVGDSIKVADFGLAKILASSVTGHTGSVTPHYAPPETFEGRVASTSDQYSLAVTYCQLRTGTLPFDGTVHEVIHGHTSQQPDLSALHVDERLIIARALAKDPEERWPSCQEFIAALKQAVLVAANPGFASPTMDVTWNHGKSESRDSSFKAGETDSGTSGIGNDTDPGPRRHWARPQRPKRLYPLLFAALVIAALVVVLGAIISPKSNFGTVKISLSDPSAAQEIMLDGNEVDVAVLGQPLRLPAGGHSLEVVGKGYERVARAFDIRRGENPAIEIDFIPAAERQVHSDSIASGATLPDRQPERKLTPSVPLPAVFTVTLEPPEAELVIEQGVGEVTGTGRRRLLTVANADGQRTLRIVAKRDGYVSVERELTPFEGQTAVLAMTLEPAPATYSVRVTPAAAELNVTGANAQALNSGATRTMIIARPNETDSATLTATLDGYRPKQLTLNPKPGDRQAIVLTLAAEPAVLMLSLEPADAQITFDPSVGRLSGTGSTRTLTVDKPDRIGDVQIVASHSGYETTPFTWTPSPGANDAHSFSLIPKPAVLTVRLEPANADLRVTSGSARVTGTGAVRTLTVPRPGRSDLVSVVTSLSGFETSRLTWSPGPGRSDQHRLQLMCREPREPARLNAQIDADKVPTAPQQSRATQSRVKPELKNSIGKKPPLIPLGEFLMGSPDFAKDRSADQRHHRVRILGRVQGDTRRVLAEPGTAPQLIRIHRK